MGGWEGRADEDVSDDEEGDLVGNTSTTQTECPNELAPGSGSFGVLRPGTKCGSPVGGLPTLKLETLEKKRTGFMLSALWASFFISLGFLLKSSEGKSSSIDATPPAAAAASSTYDATESDLIGVANYQPFTDAAQTSLFDFFGAVTVLPPNITATGNDGTNATALQWFGRNFPAPRNNRGSTLNFVAEYTDNDGILLSGEDIRFEILSFVCWDSCTASESNWYPIFTEDRPVFTHKIQVRARNEAGLPTKIRWELFSYQEYTPSQKYVSAGVRYLNDPGDANAGYSIFSENADGQFGSCGGGGDDDDGGVGASNCMRVTEDALINESYLRLNLALASCVVTILSTVVWVIFVLRSAPKGWNGWMLQQKWTLFLALGVVMYQNPIQSIWFYFDNLDNQPRTNRALEALTAAGLAIVLLVASFWADSARVRVLKPQAFYGPKAAYMAALWVFFYLGLLAIYPVNHADSGSFWAASVWCWPADRLRLFVVAEGSRAILAILSGFFYYYFLHCSFEIYSKVPYMLTRAEQLSFRFVVSTFSLFVALMVLTVVSRFAIAVALSIDDDGKAAAPTIVHAGSFFRVLFGQSIRNPFIMVYLAISVIIFEVAFLPASALHLSKYKPLYVLLESDMSVEGSPTTTHGDDGTDGGGHRHHGLVDAAGGATAAVVGGLAAAEAAAGAAATATATAAATVASAVTGGAVNVVGTVSAGPSRPVFVVERARWLAAISLQAYGCFTAEELAEKPKGRMVEVAPLGCEVVATIKELPDRNLHDTHCVIVRHKATRRLIVAFRGTVSKKQMKTDVQGWRCQINLDLLAQRRKTGGTWCSKGSTPSPTQPADVSISQGGLDGGAALAEEGELPPPQLQEAAASSKSGRSTSQSTKNAKRSHMVMEDDLPRFLLELGEVLNTSVSQPAAAAGDTKTDYDVLDMPGEESDAHLREAEEGRQGSMPSTAGKGKAYASVGGTAAAAAAAGSAAAHVLRERAAAMHTKRVASRHARASRGRVHFGFWSSYSTVRERVLAVVQRELLREPGQLYVTGHSLGGALATLAAYDLALWLLPMVNARLGRGPESHPMGKGEEHEAEIQLTMYNFGSPRVGDFFFVQRYNLLVPHTYRVVDDGDIVTGVPPKRLGYLHVGCGVIVDRTGSGSLLINPSFLEARFKKSRKTNLVAHLLGSYNAAIDGCLYPLESTEEFLALVEAVYHGRGGGEWCGCICYWLCCNARLPGWLGCRNAGCGATGATADAQGRNDADVDAQGVLAAPSNGSQEVPVKGAFSDEKAGLRQGSTGKELAF